MKHNQQWKLSPDLIHVNHAAVGPWPQRTKQAIEAFAEDNATFGSLHYSQWIKTEAELKKQLTTLINAKSSDEISLLKNTSEALSVIAYGIDWQAGDNIVISDQEFPSNCIVWESLKPKGVQVKLVSLDGDCPENNLIAACDENTRLLSISSVQYASGLKMDLKPLGEHCRQNHILFCVDAIQSIGAHAVDVADCKVDFMVADGHKWMLGPEGIALFYCRKGIRNTVKLNQFGWHMVEDFLNFDNKNWQIANNGRRFECGSPNMLGIHGLHASLSLILEIGIDNISRMIDEKIDLLINDLKDLPQINILSPLAAKRRSGIFTFSSTLSSTDKLFDYLSANKVFCAMRGGGVRLSPHYYTPDEQIKSIISYISKFR